MEHLSHPAHHQRDTLIRARDDRRCRVTDERSNRRLNYHNDNFGARLRTHFYIYTYLYTYDIYTYTTVGKKTTSNGSYLSTTAYTNEYSTLRAPRSDIMRSKKRKEKEKEEREREKGKKERSRKKTSR